jgi:uncharacterized membrane protein YcaP (DUF421 family)
MVTGEPTLLLFRGQYLEAALRRARVTEDEIRAAVRSEGVPAVEEVQAVVLETDGSFSVIAAGSDRGSSSLVGIETPGHMSGHGHG